MTALKDTVRHRLQARSRPHDGCLLWPNKPNRAGYYTISIRDRCYPLHRVVYWLKTPSFIHITDLPSNLHVRHLCSFKNCVIGDHYDAGSRMQNEADKLFVGTRHRGENSSASKLSLQNAQAIADSWGYSSTAERSKQFGVCSSTVRAIDDRNTWPEVVHPNGKTFKGWAARNREQRQKSAERHAKLNADALESIEPLFLSKTYPTGNLFNGTPCRALINAETSKIYGRFTAFGHTASAHIWACEIHQRHVMTKENPIVRHLCNNSSCVAFDHLEAGTHLENMEDYRKARIRNILSIEQEAEIRVSVERIKSLAAKYNVSEGLIKQIRRRTKRIRGRSMTNL